jgi:hypothetical protein
VSAFVTTPGVVDLRIDACDRLCVTYTTSAAADYYAAVNVEDHGSVVVGRDVDDEGRPVVVYRLEMS